MNVLEQTSKIKKGNNNKTPKNGDITSNTEEIIEIVDEFYGEFVPRRS